MDFYIIEQTPLVNNDFVFLSGKPRGIGITDWKLSEGEPLGDEYPGIDETKWYMEKKYPGIKLPSLIGNVSNVVVVHRELKDVFEAAQVPTDYVQFTLYNHKNRVASRDYFIINVLGTFDCLNYNESKIKYSKEAPGKVISVKRMVFDRRKLEQAPDIFRVKEEPETIVISQRLVGPLQKLNPTNVYLHVVEQAP